MATLYKLLCMCRGEVWNLKKGIGNKTNRPCRIFVKYILLHPNWDRMDLYELK